MLWLLYSFLSASFKAGTDALGKFGMKKVDEYVMAWSYRSFALLFLLPALFFINIPTLGKQFWIALLTSGIIVSFGTILYMRAIKVSDLSITIPMLSFTPLFLLVVSPIITGEFPNYIGLLGVLSVIVGSYVLNIKQKDKGYLAPFKALLKEKGTRIMLFVAFLWSLGANLDKIGIQNSSPIFWTIAVSTIISLMLFVIMYLQSPTQPKRQISKSLKYLVLIGLFGALSLSFQMLAFKLNLIVYVISIKRISIIIGILFGYLFFKEKNIKERFAGALIMLIGILLITWS